jgi:transposase
MASHHNIVKRWRANGYVVNKVKRPGRPPRLTHEQVSWLTSLETLQSMSHLSLRKRCQIVMERFNFVKFDRESLRKIYLKHGVKYKRPDYKFWKSMAENQQLRERQLEFV